MARIVDALSTATTRHSRLVFHWPCPQDAPAARTNVLAQTGRRAVIV
ncbi:hypothetical protein ABZU86_12055 [Streptomyces sp. NPDC005271]